MDSRTALLNAPRPLRRAAALLAPLLLAALVAGAVALVQAMLAARAERIVEARERLGTLRLLIAADPGPAETAAPEGAEFLPGDSLPLAQAAFQSRLGEIAAASGAELLAVGNMPVAERDGARFAGLRASLTGTNPQIVETVFAIESAVPYLTIRTARIEAAARTDAGDGDPVRLTMQVEIDGALPPDGGAAP